VFRLFNGRVLYRRISRGLGLGRIGGSLCGRFGGIIVLILAGNIRKIRFHGILRLIFGGIGGTAEAGAIRIEGMTYLHATAQANTAEIVVNMGTNISRINGIVGNYGIGVI
jgi:hypothetical protein